MKNSQIDPVIFSRPSQMTYDKEEVDQLLQNSDGIGLSGISDWEPPKLRRSHGSAKKEEVVCLPCK